MTIVFEEPPTRGKGTQGGSKKYKKVAAQLRKRPKEWARIAQTGSSASASSLAHQIKNGKGSAFRPPGAYQAVSRTIGSEYRVYARYVGGDDS